MQAYLVNIILRNMYILIIPYNKPSHLENKAVDPQEGAFLPSLTLTAVLKWPFLFDVTDLQVCHSDDVTKGTFPIQRLYF